MAASQKSSTSHPAPARNEVPNAIMLYALIAAPLAWISQTVANMAIARHACFPKDMPLSSPAFGYASELIAVIMLAAAVAALAGLAFSVFAWIRTRRESGGDGHDLVEIGEGRTRFLAMCAVILSTGFCIAIGFSAAGLLLVPIC